MSMVDACCAICTMPFEAPCEIQQLVCHQKHILHTECYQDWINHNERNYKTPRCPMCRAVIKKDEVVKKKMEAPAMVQNQNPFAQEKVADNVMDYDYKPPEGMPMVMSPDQQP